MFEFDKTIKTLPKNALLFGTLNSKEAVSNLDLIKLWDLINEYSVYIVNPNFSVVKLDYCIFKYDDQGMITIKETINKSEYLKGIRDEISDQKLLRAFDRAIKKFAKQVQFSGGNN